MGIRTAELISSEPVQVKPGQWYAFTGWAAASAASTVTLQDPVEWYNATGDGTISESPLASSMIFNGLLPLYNPATDPSVYEYRKLLKAPANARYVRRNPTVAAATTTTTTTYLGAFDVMEAPDVVSTGLQPSATAVFPFKDENGDNVVGGYWSPAGHVFVWTAMSNPTYSDHGWQFRDALGAVATFQNGFLTVQGGFQLQTPSVHTSSFTVDAIPVHECNSASAMTVTLPTAVGQGGRFHVIKNINTGKATIDANGSETIDGLLTYPLLEKNQAVAIVSDNSNWIIVGQVGLILESDGNRWLGPRDTWRLYDPEASLNPVGYTTNQTPWLRKMPQSKDIYWFEKITWHVRVDTTSSGSHYWVLREGHEGNTLGGTVDLDLNTSALTAGTNDIVEGGGFNTNPVDFTTTGAYTIFLELVKSVGSPGQLNIWGVEITVRKVYS